MKTQFDLNLLRLLITLEQCQSADGTIKQLSISHSTFKRGLAQLRTKFGNELFVARQGRYEATAFTRELLARLSPLMVELDAVLHQSSQLSLADLSGIFSVSAPAFLSDGLAPELQAELLAYENRLWLEICDWPQSSDLSLSAERPDIGIHFYPQRLNQLYVQQKVGSSPLGVFCQPSHPVVQRSSIELSELQRERFVRYRHLQSDLPDSIRDRLAHRGIELNVVAAVNSVAAAMGYVETFGFLAVGAQNPRLAEAYGLCWRPVMVSGEPLTYEYGFCYHRAWYQHPIMREIEAMLKTIHQRLSARA